MFLKTESILIMSAPDPEPPLRLASDCLIEFDRQNRPIITRRSRRIELGSHGLALLDGFRQPAAAGDVLSSIKSRLHGAQEWIECMRLVSRMQAERILVSPEEQQPSAAPPTGFASPSIHIAMLNDKRRTTSFIQAIRESIRPDDVVLEIGTGTGVLAATAAQAGARKVYAVEQTAVADAAESLFAVNGVADQVRLIRGASTEIELPEPADVVIGEVFGHDALEENVLESFLDAGRRHLKPGGRFLPREVTIVAAPVRLPPELLAQKRFSNDALSNWNSAYDLDFSPLQDWQNRSPDHYLASRTDLEKVQLCSQPVRFPAIEFSGLSSSIVELEAALQIDSPGRIDGVLLWFELQLADGVTLNSHPAEPRPDNHWRTPIHLRAAPFSAEKGDNARIRYEYGRNSMPFATITPASNDS